VAAPRAIARQVVLALVELVITLGVVMVVSYAVVGQAATLAISGIAIGLALSRAQPRTRQASILHRLLIAIPTGIAGVIVAMALRSGRLIVLAGDVPVPLPERLIEVALLFGLFGALAGFVYCLVVVRLYMARTRAYARTSVFVAVVFLVMQVRSVGWPTWPPWGAQNLVHAETAFTGLVGGLALVFGFTRLGEPAALEMRRAMREFARAQPYLLAMLRPVEAIVFIYVLVILGFACAFASIYRLDPGAFAASASRGTLGFGDFVYFSVVTMSTVGYGDLAPASTAARAAAVVEILFAAFFVVVAFAALTAYLQQAWSQLASGGPPPNGEPDRDC